MQLDMYAWTFPRPPGAAVDFYADFAKKLHYWKNHADLHEWMEALYRHHGGRDPDFNCSTVLLSRDDLDALEEAVRSRALPRSSRFDQRNQQAVRARGDLAFIAKARAAIAQGHAVFYSSWW